MRFENIDGDFKEVPGYKGYFVTKDGKLVTARRGKPKVMKFRMDHEGYYTMTVCIDGKYLKLKRARAIALAWIPNSNPKYYNNVCHNDGTRNNDNVNNLRWGTFQENMQDKRQHGTNVASGGKRKLVTEQVEAIREAFENGQSILRLAKEYALDRATIRRCVNYVTYQDVA